MDYVLHATLSQALRTSHVHSLLGICQSYSKPCMDISFSQLFHLSLFVSLLFVPVVTASDIGNVKQLPLIIFNKCPPRKFILQLVNSDLGQINTSLLSASFRELPDRSNIDENEALKELYPICRFNAVMLLLFIVILGCWFFSLEHRERDDSRTR